MQKRNERGFTLIEMLLVMVIMGIMLAVIVPRAWRANVDSKYTLCRQNCTELAKFAQEWCETMLLAQSETAEATLNEYYASLKHNGGNNFVELIGERGACNWNNNGNLFNVDGRNHNGNAALPETSVQDTMPQDKVMRNPFNGSNVFADANDITVHGAVTGAIGFAGRPDENDYIYYALLFQGTDNTSSTPTSDSAWHAGMGPQAIGNVRNGIFVARVR